MGKFAEVLGKILPSQRSGSGPLEGEQARVAAEHHLQRAKEQRPEVQSVANSLRTLREENHFALRIEGLIRGERR